MRIAIDNLPSATMVPNEFIDRIMPAANGEYVKVFLYLLRHNGEEITPAHIADALELTEGDVRRALMRWQREGLISVPQENGEADIKVLLSDMSAEAADAIDRAEAAGGLTIGERNENQYVISFAEDAAKKTELSQAASQMEKFSVVEEEYMKRVGELEKDADTISAQLKNAFAFIKDNLGEGNEMLIFVTELTFDPASARFIAEHGSEEYNKYNQKFMLYERNAELAEQVRRWRHYDGHSKPGAGGNAGDDERAEEAAKQGIAVETIKLSGTDKNKQN